MKVIAITDRHLVNENLFTLQVRKIMTAKPDLVILRERDAPKEFYEQFANEVIFDMHKYKEVISLTHPDIACKHDIDKVHLTMGQLRSERPKVSTVGVSVHTIDEAKEAESLGANYVIAGHIYKTNCKKDVPPRGLKFLSDIVNAVKIPVYAVGGITEENYRETIEAGAAGICMRSAFMLAEEPEKLVQGLKNSL